MDHEVLLHLLAEHVKDNRFLRLISNLLRAGYLEAWRYHRTLSGCPQGSVISPLLSNIYLHQLDTYVEQVLIPKYTRGKRRRPYLKYHAMRSRAVHLKKQGKRKEAKTLWTAIQRMPSGDPGDPDYRRLRYIRYADDTLFGFIGPKAEAEEIKETIRAWLRDHLKLELSREKTLITNATTEAARFLGYDIVAQRANDKHHPRSGYRSINGRIGLRVPAEVIQKRCQKYMQKGVASHRNELIDDEDFTIISRYQAEYRGLVHYYLLAYNVSWFHQLHWVMQTSLLRTLAKKHQTSLKAMEKKYRATIETPHGMASCLKIVVEREQGKKPLTAYFGGIPLRRQERASLTDLDPDVSQQRSQSRSELLQRLRSETCELCNSKQNIEVHHVRKLADLTQKGRREKPLWMKRMAARRRKTLMVCAQCHKDIHNGTFQPRSRKQSLESGVQ